MAPVTRLSRALDVSQAASAWAEDLLQFNFDGDEALISLPQLYPGGSPIVVGVRRDQQTYIVSDRGGAYVQAEQAGGHLQFNRTAAAIAKEHDVRFDGHLMFVIEVPMDWVPNAIVFIAAASRRSVELTFEKLAEEKDTSAQNQLREVLRESYGDRASFDVGYSGYSTRKHHFAAMVQDHKSIALFDLVTPHHVSINSTFVKFSDVGRLDEAPNRVAVLSNKSKMNTGDINLISEIANFVVPVSVEIAKIPIAA